MPIVGDGGGDDCDGAVADSGDWCAPIGGQRAIATREDRSGETEHRVRPGGIDAESFAECKARNAGVE